MSNITLSFITLSFLYENVCFLRYTEPRDNFSRSEYEWLQLDEGLQSKKHKGLLIFDFFNEKSDMRPQTLICWENIGSYEKIFFFFKQFRLKKLMQCDQAKAFWQNQNSVFICLLAINMYKIMKNQFTLSSDLYDESPRLIVVSCSEVMKIC